MIRGLRPRHLASLALLAVTACGGASTTSSSSSSAPGTPAPTAENVSFTAATFSLTIPTGWTNMTLDQQTYQQTVRTDEGTGVLVITHPVPGAFSNSVNDVIGNIVVLQLNNSNTVPDDQLQAYVRKSRAGATNLTAPVAVDVDGVPAFQIGYHADIKGTPGQDEEVFVNHDGHTYDISLTTSQFAFSDQAKDLRVLLQSWKWKT